MIGYSVKGTVGTDEWLMNCKCNSKVHHVRFDLMDVVVVRRRRREYCDFVCASECVMWCSH